MRKFWIPAAAAALLIPGAAEAKVPVLNLGEICTFMAVVVDGAKVSGFSNYDCQTGNFVGTHRDYGWRWAGDHPSVELKNTPKHSQYLLQVQYPLVKNGAWSMYYTRDGYKAKLYQSGTYTVIK